MLTSLASSRMFETRLPVSDAGSDWGTLHLFNLGAATTPADVVGLGPRVRQSNRNMLETPPVCDTMSDAVTETEKR